ncbi:MAG: hypothetical protein ACRELC_14525 [Gemmatimonadota bacterium]
MRGAARRIAILLGVVLGVTALVSLLVGLAAGSSASRSVSAGFYIVGCFLVVFGFFSGLRGPVRARGRDEADERPLSAFFSSGLWGGVRTASPDERADALGTAWFFLLLGILLVLAGVLVDSRVGFL